MYINLYFLILPNTFIISLSLPFYYSLFYVFYWATQYISTRSVNIQVICKKSVVGHFDWYWLINWSRLFLHFYTLRLQSNSLVASKMANALCKFSHFAYLVKFLDILLRNKTKVR